MQALQKLANRIGLISFCI